MNILNVKQCIHFAVEFLLRTPLLLRSGDEGDYSDSTVERTADGAVHVNGYVWASLLRRALARVNGTDGLVERIGRYERDDQGKVDSLGVSVLWCDSTIAASPGSDIRPGNRIDRGWGSAVKKALYSEEVEDPGLILPLEGNVFCESKDELDNIKKMLTGALWVINEGIENIGGGWSYGFGRLKVAAIGMETLDLEARDKTPEQKKAIRKRLWDFSGMQKNVMSPTKPDIKKGKGWTKFSVNAAIEAGNLLAISSNQPDYESYQDWPHLPDAFVFRAKSLMPDNTVKRVPVITGKAFRQAVLSVNIERRLKTQDKAINKNYIPLWFGLTDQGGIIAVLDAPVMEAATEVLHRIQLCEHSFQNIQLFSGEYLTSGNFEIQIFVDKGQDPKESEVCIGYVKELLAEMGPEECPQDSAVEVKDENKKQTAPPGWYRLGATSTSTGQFTVKKWSVDDVG